MPPRPKARLDDIVASATRIFSEKGYRRTLITDVAADLGIAPGTIYTYVESKDALFHLVVERASGVTTEPAALPIPTPAETMSRSMEAFGRTWKLTELRAALKREKADDVVEELSAIVRELYASMSQSRVLMRLLERSAVDVPELRTSFYVKGRRGFLKNIESYLVSRIEIGQLRAVPDTAASTRFIVEAISWFANHRHGDQDSDNITDLGAEQVCVDMIVHALLP